MNSEWIEHAFNFNLSITNLWNLVSFLIFQTMNSVRPNTNKFRQSRWKNIVYITANVISFRPSLPPPLLHLLIKSWKDLFREVADWILEKYPDTANIKDHVSMQSTDISHNKQILSTSNWPSRFKYSQLYPVHLFLR